MPSAPPSRGESVDAVVVSLAVVLSAGVGLWAFLVDGGPADILDLGAAPTLMTPLFPSVAAWAAIALGTAAYAVRLWLPGAGTWERGASVPWLSAGVMIAHVAWLLSVRTDMVALGVPFVAAQLVMLARLMVLLTATPAASPVERVLTDGVFGLILGWSVPVMVMTIAAALVRLGVPATGPVATGLSVAALACCAVAGVGAAAHFPGGYGVGAGAVWAFGWIAAARLGGEPVSWPVGVTAVLAAVVVVVAYALPVPPAHLWLARNREGVAKP